MIWGSTQKASEFRPRPSQPLGCCRHIVAWWPPNQIQHSQMSKITSQQSTRPTLMSSSSNFVKKFCKSLPRKWSRISCQSGGLCMCVWNGNSRYPNQQQTNKSARRNSPNSVWVCEQESWVQSIYQCHSYPPASFPICLLLFLRYQSQHTARSRHRKTMELEGVRPIAMRRVFGQTFRQVEDSDGFEWAFL